MVRLYLAWGMFSKKNINKSRYLFLTLDFYNIMIRNLVMEGQEVNERCVKGGTNLQMQN